MCSVHRPYFLYYLSNPLEKNGQNPTYPRNKSSKLILKSAYWIGNWTFLFNLSKISFTEKIG